jgi:hypothetical protein
MASEITYRCDRCSSVQQLCTGSYRFYTVVWQGEDTELFDRVPCDDDDGWCRCCRRLRPVESIPDVQLLERMKQLISETGLSDLERELAAKAGRSEAEELKRRLKRVDERIRWRMRVSPPKCFVCGSTDIEPPVPSPDGTGYRHPGCGGVFRFCGFPVHFQPANAFLIPSEGPKRRWSLWRALAWSLRRPRKMDTGLTSRCT